MSLYWCASRLSFLKKNYPKGFVAFTLFKILSDLVNAYIDGFAKLWILLIGTVEKSMVLVFWTEN